MLYLIYNLFLHNENKNEFVVQVKCQQKNVEQTNQISQNGLEDFWIKAAVWNTLLTFLALVNTKFLAEVFCLKDWKIGMNKIIRTNNCSNKLITSNSFLTIVMHTNLGDLLFSDSEPDLTSPCIQLLDGEMFLLHHGQRSIMGKLCKDLGDIRTPLIQKLSLSPFLLFLHLF